jgi:hypothetical protein
MQPFRYFHTFLYNCIQALLHVSTGYAHVDKGDATIEEKIYEPPLTPEKAVSMIR